VHICTCVRSSFTKHIWLSRPPTHRCTLLSHLTHTSYTTYCPLLPFLFARDGAEGREQHAGHHALVPTTLFEYSRDSPVCPVFCSHLSVLMLYGVRFCMGEWSIMVGHNLMGKGWESELWRMMYFKETRGCGKCFRCIMLSVTSFVSSSLQRHLNLI